MNQLVTDSCANSNQPALDTDTSQYLTFMLQGEMFGLNILPIKEISEYGKITTVPMLPDYVRGVINLRGNVVPVIDLPVRFGWEKSPVNKRSCIVVFEVETGCAVIEIGIVIDSISEVIDIPPTDIGSPPSFGAKIRTDFISGMGKVGEDFIVLLNASRVLSTDELSRLEEVKSIN